MALSDHNTEAQVCLYPDCEAPMARDGLCKKHLQALVCGRRDVQGLAADCVRTWHAIKQDGRLAHQNRPIMEDKAERTPPMDDNLTINENEAPPIHPSHVKPPCRAPGCKEESHVRGVCKRCARYVTNRRSREQPDNDRSREIKAAMLPPKRTGKNRSVSTARPEPKLKPAATASPKTALFEFTHRLCRGLGLTASVMPDQLVVMGPDKTKCVAVTTDGELRTYHQATV